MTPESIVNREIESALMHHKIYVMPRQMSRLSISPWSLPDPAFHLGVMWRENTGVARYGRQSVRFGVPGHPDWTGWAFKRGLRLSIEAKRPGARETPIQRSYAILAQMTGICHGVVCSYDDCCRLLNTWGFEKVR